MKEYVYVHTDGEEKLVEAFKTVPFLASLADKDLKRILSSGKIREYEAEETIIVAGERDRWIYILLIGKVKVMKQGKEISQFDQTGDVFGELAVVDTGVRSASVVAVERTHCLAFEADFLNTLELTEQSACYAVLYRLFATMMANRLRATSAELARVKAELEQLKQR